MHIKDAYKKSKVLCILSMLHEGRRHAGKILPWSASRPLCASSLPQIPCAA